MKHRPQRIERSRSASPDAARTDEAPPAAPTKGRKGAANTTDPKRRNVYQPLDAINGLPTREQVANALALGIDPASLTASASNADSQSEIKTPGSPPRNFTPTEKIDGDNEPRAYSVLEELVGVRTKGATPSMPARARFLLALSERPNAVMAARSAGCSLWAFEQLRSTDQEFAELWETANSIGAMVIQSHAYELAFHGIDGDPIYQNGRKMGYRRKFNDRLASDLLIASNPQKYSPRHQIIHAGLVQHQHSHGLTPELDGLLKDLAGPARQVAPSTQAIVDARAERIHEAAVMPSIVDAVRLDLDKPETEGE